MFQLSPKMFEKLSAFQKKPFIYFLDFQSIFLAYSMAFLLRFDFSIPAEDLKILIISFPLIFIIKAIWYIYLKIDSILWRYTSVKDLINIIKAFSISNVIFGLLLFILFQFEGYPRSIIIIDWFLSIMFLGGLRFVYRIYFKKSDSSFEHNKKCLIIGSGDAAEFLIREMVSNHHVDYNPVGILDDKAHTWNRILHGVKILGPIKDLYKHCKRLQIEEIIIAIPSATNKEMKAVVEYCEACRELGVAYKTVPGINDILFGKQSPTTIRDIKLEDLINRELVVTNKLKTREEYGNKRILITGAAGSIGSELVRQLAECRPSLIVLVDRNENNLMYLEKELNEIVPKINYQTMIVDITNERKMDIVYNNIRPQFVFHAAAYKHVSYMEDQPDEAVKNNIFGTYLLAQLANKYKVKKFVMISTDKAVRPTSVMGCTKRVAELGLLNMFHKSKTEFVVVRFGNVIGSEGSVVPIFQKQIKNGGPVTVTDPKMIRYFMTIPEAVRLTLQAGHIGNHKEILILDMGEQIPVLEIAENLITLSGLKPYVDIAIKFTGARPGEKLYEELWNNNENPIPTYHPKIFKASNDMRNYTFDENVFNELISSSNENSNPDLCKSLLKVMVPSYQYNPKMMKKNA